MITAVSFDKHTPPSKQPEYQEIYGRLNAFIEVAHAFMQRVNEKIVNRIQIVKHTYVDQYAEHMKIMSAQLKDIKEQIDQARLKERANEKMFVLEEERDYFRFQVGKLDGEVRKLQADIKSLRKALAEARDEIKNYKHICFKLEENASKLKSEVLEIYSAKQLELQQQSETIPMTERKSSERNVKTAGMPRVRSSTSRQFRATTTARQAPLDTLLASRTLAVPPTEHQQILAECIREMKKQIFYRNLKQEELSVKYFEQDKLIPFERFSKTDRKELLYRFLGHTDVLEKFYKFVFGGSTQQPKEFAGVKPFDDKYNRTNLQLMKKKFEERIRSTKSRSNNFMTESVTIQR